MQDKVYTLIADFAVRNRLAYLSHQETLTLFQRALIRGQVPIAFSRGFNPRPRMSIPLPRSVGCQSDAERLCAILSPGPEWSADGLAEAIDAQLPDDFHLQQVQCLEGKHTFVPRNVRYRFSLAQPADACQSARFDACRLQVESKEPIEIQRFWAKKKCYKTMDISGYLEAVEVFDQSIEVLCAVSQAGTVRVDELMSWLGIETSQLCEPVRRLEIQWQGDNKNEKQNEGFTEAKGEQCHEKC